MPLAPAHSGPRDTNPPDGTMDNMRFSCLLPQGLSAICLERSMGRHHQGLTGGIGAHTPTCGGKSTSRRLRSLHSEDGVRMAIRVPDVQA